MTWLSRLLSPNSGFSRVNARNHGRRARQAGRFRRMSQLESLEQRRLLAGNVTVAPVVGGLLTITPDTGSDTFTIREDGNNVVTVQGGTLGNPFQGLTTINSQLLGVGVTSSQVTNIVVNMPSNGRTADTIYLVHNPANTTQTGIANVTFNVQPAVPASAAPAALNLTVGGSTTLGVTNLGVLSVQDPSAGNGSGGQLTVNVDHSNFGAINIFQTGCCPASVTLTNDHAGSVSVTEGMADGDYIDVGNDNFGTTVLKQGVGSQVGPNGKVCHGDNDQIFVHDSNLHNLTITQPKGVSGIPGDNHGPNGINDHIVVGKTPQGAFSEVEVDLTSFGIRASQGDGHDDYINIESITTNGDPNNNLIGNGGPDSIVTSQGNGDNDITYVQNARVYGDITVTQGNGNHDQAWLRSNYAGWVITQILPPGPQIIDMYGTGTIKQGNGVQDLAVVDCHGEENDVRGINRRSIYNNLNITQGDGTPTPDCQPPYNGDTIMVDCTTVVSDMTIVQGSGGTSLGWNTVLIGTIDPSGVHVGDITSITENGANNGNNTIELGGAHAPNSGSTDFETGYLSVYAGAFNNFVQVFNSEVDFLTFGYNITSGGAGNVALEDFQSFMDGVMIDPGAFVVTLI